MNLNLVGDPWVPDSCTLPTAEQPLRIDEFDNFFSNDATGLSRTNAGLTIEVRPDAAGRAAELAVKETGCCSFFTFELTIRQRMVDLTVTAPGHDSVLEALADRAARLIAEVAR